MKTYAYLDYRLTLEQVSERSGWTKAKVRYCFKHHKTVLFEGDDLEPSPMIETEGPEAAAHLLDFYLAQEEDKDPDYFALTNEYFDLTDWQDLLNPKEVS